MTRLGLGSALLLGVLAACTAGAVFSHLIFGTPILPTAGILATGTIVTFVISSLKSTLHIIRDFPTEGKWDWHIAKWEMKNYDRRLASGVRFARHAISIDETRADFPRVEWGYKAHQYVHINGQPDPLMQIWFAGNHSDIGGSYPEEESRLSDIALRWMADEATSVPEGLKVDYSRLNSFPSPAGMQHCEVDRMRDAVASYLPRWWPRAWLFTWREHPRLAVKGAPVHPSVEERLALPAVLKCGRLAPYRPISLRDDDRFKHFYTYDT